MKRVLTAITSLAVLALAVPAFAGEGKHCTAGTQECLDQMAKKLSHRGYIGIEMDETETHAVVIKGVLEDSPAARAGLESGDILLTVNGMAPEEAFQALQEKMVPGAELALAIERNGHGKDLAVVLEQAPEEMVSRWIGHHMLQHTSRAMAEEE